MATATKSPAARHYERVQRLQAEGLLALRRAWDLVDSRHIAASWAEVTTTVAAPALRATMTRAAEHGAVYGIEDLASRGEYVRPERFVIPSGFSRTAPSGATLELALAVPAIRALMWIGEGYDIDASLMMGRRALDGLVRTFISDVGRMAQQADIATRPGVGYVRMVNPPSCAACVVLAGRWYRFNEGFKRHPRCDCIHRPATSLQAAKQEGLIDDPYSYFHSLSEAEQNRIFGRANAQAIRDGADIYRVGNAWRGRRGLYTAEGTSRRGFAANLRGQRLTPEGIYRTAGSREEALALLERHGYVTGPQVAGGNIRGANYEGFGQMGRGGTRVGATQAVLQARETGIRDPLSPYTATAAERRVIDARNAYEAALEGRHPYISGAPVTPEVLADAEIAYRTWLAKNGEIYTA